MFNTSAKNIFLSLIFVSLFLTSCSEMYMLRVFHGDESKWTEVKANALPPVVMDAFSMEYHGIKASKWYVFPNERYAAVFEKNGRKRIALFSASGVLQDEDMNFQDDYYDEYDDYFDSGNYD